MTEALSPWVRLASVFRVVRSQDGKTWCVEALCGPAYENGLVDRPSSILSDHAHLEQAVEYANSLAEGRLVYWEGEVGSAEDL